MKLDNLTTSCLLLIVIVKNHGSTTITYEWKRVQRGDHIASKKSDFLQRFFCHYVSKLSKPKPIQSVMSDEGGAAHSFFWLASHAQSMKNIMFS